MRELVPTYQNEYLMTKSIIDMRREKWMSDYNANLMQKKKPERILSRDETIKIFMKIQEMTRELYQRVGKVRDENLRDEYQIENILLADRITIDFQVSSQHFDDMFRRYNLHNNP